MLARYGTLNTYFSDETVEGCKGRGKAVFRNYMSKVTGELHQLITEGLGAKMLNGDGDTVAVFGHAVFLNAVAVASHVEIRPLMLKCGPIQHEKWRGSGGAPIPR